MTKNWKTTLSGLIAGLLMLVGSAMQNRATDPNAPPVTLGNIATSAAVVALGALAKDHNVSGS